MQEAKKLFQKLKITSLFDLFLILPTKYEDRQLSLELEEGSLVTLKAEVQKSSVSGGKLKVFFYLPDFNMPLSSFFFKTTSYHYGLFAIGSKHILNGKLEIYNGNWQISQPKSIKNSGEITPKYKSSIGQKELKALIEYFITKENLIKEGLTQEEANLAYSIHFPKTLKNIYNDGWSKEVLELLKFIEAFNHIKKLHSKKTNFKAMKSLKGDPKEFIESLPFKLTNEQSKTVEEIRKSLKGEIASKRMVVGDVGSGKTIVILASVMVAYPNKSILMAPTSLLAIQLYEEALKFLPKKIKIAFVMQGKEKGDFKEDDFIIGTHALLFKEELPKVPLVMIDEQHRFGSKQRQLLQNLVEDGKEKPHIIQFSATPIPRTQAMIDSELLDVSLITTTPFKKEIETLLIGKQDFKNLLEHIKLEIAKNHQILIVYPLVEESKEIPYQSIDEGRAFWETRFEKVFVTYGKDKQKEEVLLKFREDGNILLATTVIEVGISLPRLTLIVIVGAERLGLATLHQLRGRVGRNGLKSWCYLYSNEDKIYRLERFANTTNGFDIAKLDLKFRDSGDILDGTIQSGQKIKWLDMSEDEKTILKAKERAKKKNL